METVQSRKKSLIDSQILNIKSAILTLMIAVFVINVIYPGPYLRVMINYITVAVVLISLPFTGRGTRFICMVLFVAGAYLIYVSGGGWLYWVEAMGKNTSLLALLIAVPLLGVPLRFGGYVGVLDALAAKYMARRYQMYWVPALFAHVLGVFLNLGAVPLTHEITARGKLHDNPGTLAKSISRGFGMALFWSPNMVATALTLGYLNVPWQNYVHLGLLIAVVGLLVGYAVELSGREGRVEEPEPASGGCRPYIDRVKLGQLAAAAVVFLLIIILIETKTDLSVISTVPVIALAFPVIWLFLLGKKETIKKGYLDYFNNKINRYDGEVVLFVAAGFFSSALTFSGWSEKLCHYIMHFSGHSKASIVLTILMSIILTSLVGIHPMILVSTFAASLDPAALGIYPAHLALILIGGWSLGATVSPLSGTTLVVAGVAGKTPVEVGYANLLFAAVVSAALITFVAWQ